jgi:DnaK suppressor protein
VPSKKPVKKPVKKAAAPAKKPAVKKAAPKSSVKIKVKAVVKKVAPKVAVKKPATKPAAKKVTAKKPIAKPVVKKTAPKAAVKKAPAKKVVAKKAAPVKQVAKSTPKKPVAAKPVAPLKKPLAPLAKTTVKASPKPREITPIKAPSPVVLPKSRPASDTKNAMNLTILPHDYEPTDNEEFMSPVMKEYFRQRLLTWRDELLRESGETLHTLHEEGNMQKPDITDRASEETDLAIEFRTRDRERKLINKIGEAIGRIEDGSYGYCEETGDPIPVKRLIARPTAVRTLEAEELHERRERTQRDQYE